MTRVRARAAAVTLLFTLATLSLGHDLTHWLGHGGALMKLDPTTASDHERCWSLCLLLCMVALFVVAATGVRELRRLARQAASVGSGRVSIVDPGIDQLVMIGLPLWAQMAFGALAGVILEANVEALSAGQGLPGLSVISGDHAVSIPIIFVIAALFAAVRALGRWRRDMLLASLGLPRPHHPRPRAIRPSFDTFVVLSAAHGLRDSVRAPPTWAALPN